MKMKLSSRTKRKQSRCEGVANEILMLMRSNKKTQQEISLNDCLGHDSDGNEVTFMDILSSDDEEVVDEVGLHLDIKKLYRYIDETLKDREKEIILLRYGLRGKPYTQREIAKNMNISRSYVSRIEKKALGKLKKQFDEGKPQ